jgi:CheY-like chemotaxis protein
MLDQLTEPAWIDPVPNGHPLIGLTKHVRSSRTVLLVEDDAQMLKLVSRTLSSLGHEVVEAQDGEQALNALYHDPTIDCMFSDVVMPNGMNGVRLAREARSFRPNLRALLTSAKPFDEVCAMEEIPYGVTFIPKPYSLTDINTLLRLTARKPPRRPAARKPWQCDPADFPPPRLH